MSGLQVYFCDLSFQLSFFNLFCMCISPRSVCIFVCFFLDIQYFFAMPMPILIICSTFLFTYIGLFSVLLPLLLLARSIAEFIFEQFQFLFCCSSCLVLYLHISFGFTLCPQCVVLKYNIFLYLEFIFGLFMNTNKSIL